MTATSLEPLQNRVETPALHSSPPLPKCLRCIVAILCTAGSLTLMPSARGAEGDGAEEKGGLLHSFAVGWFAHDVGPTADDHERGHDPNFEVWFNPPASDMWASIGSPFIHLGLTPNFEGDTTELYGGLTYQLSLTHGFFFAPAAGLALHNGPLHKDKVGCDEDSDCGFSYRILPRFAFDLGFEFGGHHAFSFFYDHMSHKYLLPGENEGIDHIGVRYRYTF